MLWVRPGELHRSADLQRQNLTILAPAYSKPLRTIGIPRSLLFYRYGVLWTTFFEALGYDVVLSDPTDKAIVEQGDNVSVDECCLASKAFMGHVLNLKDRCDAVFIPSFGNSDPRIGFCTKFQAQQDLVRNTFGKEGPIILTLRVEHASDKKQARKAFIDLAEQLGATPQAANRAWKVALGAYESDLRQKAANQEQMLRLLDEYRSIVARDTTGKEQAPLGILVVAHPYIAHDPYMSGAIIEALKEAGATVLFADETHRERTLKKSFEFSRTIPWVVSRELIGSILLLQDRIDGIVLVSAFPCGPDSMINDAIMRFIQGTPILNLMIDAQSGTAGIQTRIESFMDILRFQKQGGYTHG